MHSEQYPERPETREMSIRMGLSLCAVLFLLADHPLVSQVLAFPGADGFGRFTTGGRGGVVCEVNNLNDDGPGSFRAAIQTKGTRTIVFRVSGTLSLESDLVIRHGDLTIAGETAPGGGICVRNYPTIIEADNVIIRFMRFRLGDEKRQAADAMSAIGRRDIIVDHCSFSWGMDEVATFYNNENFTLQWSIVSESLDSSYHPKGKHGYGGIWGGYRATFHHNLLAHHSSRNPRFQGGRWEGWEKKEEVDFRYNVVFNWGFECAYGGESGKQNIVANYFKPGPASVHPRRFLSPSDGNGRWYVAENFVSGYPEITQDNTLGIEKKYGEQLLVSSPFISEMSATETAGLAYDAVLRCAGATLPRRDSVDVRILAEVATGIPTYGDASYALDHPKLSRSKPLGIINSQSTVGGWPRLFSEPPPADSDRDGIPDSWEQRHGLDPENADDGRVITRSGYTNLELYLHDLASSRP